MRSANKGWLLAALSCVALASAIPAIGQDDPKSLLPPGFGDPVQAPEKKAGTDQSKPADLLPDSVKPPEDAADLAEGADGTPEDQALAEGEELPVDLSTLPDLPAGMHRSTAQVGILDVADGGMGAKAFGGADGRYLSHLMRKTPAPIASRWASILLRRALLSKVDTPRGLRGADWVAERAWLLLRMGEADAARALVQSVDVDQYTPKMLQVAMQASLASADPSGLCPMVEPAAAVSREPSWNFARAMCAALSGESAQASALIDIAKARYSNSIDGLLAEKVVGAGVNTRRAVVIQWDDVPVLTAWRFGLANATAVDIPDRLLSGTSLRVSAWRARAPLVPVDKRMRDADIAAALGVFSNAALVDFYGQAADATDPSAISGTPQDWLRKAYDEADQSDRVDAMRSLWNEQSLDDVGKYARFILTARAAARLDPESSISGDVGPLIQSMLSAGLDVQAAKWAPVIANFNTADGMSAWGALAVGAPGHVVDWSRARVEAFESKLGGGTGLRGRLLFAGMAGLGRLNPSEVSDLSKNWGVFVERQTPWTRALDRAVAAREPATVALLCALGLGGADWSDVSPAHLYRVVSALNAVGMGPEARMIAAEAVTRS
jgi:hypothetical protein